MERHVRQLPHEAFARIPPELRDDPQEDRSIEHGDGRDTRLRPHRGSEPKPVADSRVLIERVGQCRVHVQEDGDGQHGIGGSPAPGDRREHDRQHEDRIGVALVDAGRHDVERERQDGQADEDREAIRAPGGDQRDDRGHRQHQRTADEDRRDRAEQGDPRAATIGAPRTVADPQTGVREAVARVPADDGPRVERVDREVWVAGCRRKDLAQQPGPDIRRVGTQF